MHFSDLIFLLLLIPLAILIWWRERDHSAARATLPYPDVSMTASLPSSWRVRYRKTVPALIYAGLALAIVALARPQSVLKGEEARARGIDIMICLDTSGSMRALDFDPLDRMAEAKKAAKIFITHRHYDRIGLVAFAGVAILECPLTLDYGALVDFLDQIEVGVTTTENTAIGTAIATACNHLKKSGAKSKVIILVTDGRNNSGEIDPLTAAKAAAALGIKIYAIGVGKRGQSIIPVQDNFGNTHMLPINEDLDEAALQDIAHSTGGDYFRATSAKEFEEIYSQIDKLEKTDIIGPSAVTFEDNYLGWLVIAMLCLSGGFLLERTVWRTFP
jgi:Ca-activated chloride channel family protein